MRFDNKIDLSILNKRFFVVDMNIHLFLCIVNKELTLLQVQYMY